MKQIHIILFSSLILLASSCQKQPIQHFEGRAFGTIYHISYLGQKSEQLSHEVDSILAFVNSTFSIFDTNSLISKINRGEDVELNDDFKYILELSKKVAEETGGAFDFTCQPLIELWGFGRQNQKQVVPQQQIDSVKEFVGYQMVHLDRNRIVKDDPRIQLNFNAIVKGYAVDKVSRFLKSKGFENNVVEIGGEVVVAGTKNGKPWKIGIQKPTASADAPIESNETFLLQDQAVATSGNYRNYFEKDGIRYTHIMSPVTGKPEQTNLLSVTVIAPDCATADAYATAFMVLGAQRANEITQRHPELQIKYYTID